MALKDHAMVTLNPDNLAFSMKPHETSFYMNEGDVLKMAVIQWKHVVADFFYMHTNNWTTVKTQKSLICMVLRNFISPVTQLSFSCLIVRIMCGDLLSLAGKCRDPISSQISNSITFQGLFRPNSLRLKDSTQHSLRVGSVLTLRVSVMATTRLYKSSQTTIKNERLVCVNTSQQCCCVTVMADLAFSNTAKKNFFWDIDWYQHINELNVNCKSWNNDYCGRHTCRQWIAAYL